MAIEPWSIDDELDTHYVSGVHLRPEHVLHHPACAARERDTKESRAAKGKMPQTQSRQSNGSWAVLWLANGAPPEVIAAAYRALAKIHHPDVGGSEEQMKKINDAHESLTRKRRSVAL